jgi:hypothetical protein
MDNPDRDIAETRSIYEWDARDDDVAGSASTLATLRAASTVCSGAFRARGGAHHARIRQDLGTRASQGNTQTPRAGTADRPPRACCIGAVG